MKSDDTDVVNTLGHLYYKSKVQIICYNKPNIDMYSRLNPRLTIHLTTINELVIQVGDLTFAQRTIKLGSIRLIYL